MSPSTPRLRPHRCSTCHVEQSFCPMPDELRAVFESLKTSVSYQPGAIVFNEAAPCERVFVICEGSVKLITTSTGGKILLLRFGAPGELLGGAEAMLDGAPYECSAIVTEPSILASVPRETFVRFIGSYPAASVRLTVALSEQYGTAQREARFLGFGEPSVARLARLLLDWSAPHRDDGTSSIRVPAHVTHMELAQAIGSTRETVTRILAKLDHRGIIERTDEEIVIRAPEELRRIASE